MARLPHQVLVYLHTPPGPGGEILYLLLLRHPDRFGIWQGVTGGQEEGETVADAAAREVREETGFPAQAAEVLPFASPHTFPLEGPFRRFYPGHDRVTEHRFHLPVPMRDPVLDPAEHVAFRWCGLAEALDRLHWASNRQALEELHQSLLGGEG
jgi:dATP pyrophosphohydrolase